MGANTGPRPEQALERERAAVATEAESMGARLAAALAEVQQREQGHCRPAEEGTRSPRPSPCALVVQSQIQLGLEG